VWRELFKYPRSMAAACLTGISQTGSVGLTLWLTPCLCWCCTRLTDACVVSDYLGRRRLDLWAVVLRRDVRRDRRRLACVISCVIAEVTMSMAGYLANI